MKEETFDRIKKCIVYAVEHDVGCLSSETSLTDDLHMESIHIVSLQVELEDEFGIEFDPLEDDFFEIFQTIGSVCETIEKKLENRKE